MSNSAYLLIDACLEKDTAEVERLLSEGACPSDLLHLGSESKGISDPCVLTSALHVVCLELGDLALLKLLSSKKCDYDVRDSNGCTPLHHACFSGYTELIFYLIRVLNCNPNARTYDGRTALHMACSFGYSEIKKRDKNFFKKTVWFLTDEIGCDWNAVTNKGETPLMMVCRYNNYEPIVEHLVYHCHCDTVMKDCNGNTALHIACMQPAHFSRAPPETMGVAEMRSKENVVKAISSRHWGLHLVNNQNDTPVEVALANDLLEIASFLINKMYMDECRDIEGNTLLHIACKKGNVKLLKQIKKLKCVSELSLPNKVGDTPLHSACQKGCPDVFAELKAMQLCNVFSKNVKGEIPVHVAIKYRNWTLVEQILTSPLNVVDTVNQIGSIAGLLPKSYQRQLFNDRPDIIHVASGGGIGHHSNLDALKVINEHQLCDPKYFNRLDELNRGSPLHYACRWGRLEDIVYLVNKCNADVTARTRTGNTVLHMTCKHRKPQLALEIIAFLISTRKCDPNVIAISNGNTTVMDLAYDKEKHIVVNTLTFLS